MAQRPSSSANKMRDVPLAGRRMRRRLEMIHLSLSRPCLTCCLVQVSHVCRGWGTDERVGSRGWNSAAAGAVKVVERTGLK